MSNFVLTPAYGRDYKNKKELLEDLNSGKDFVANSFSGTTYINRQELDKLATQVQIRYGNQLKVMVAKFSAQKNCWV
jgi:hypothetical protein